MKRADIILKARHFLNDLEGAVFSDEELGRFLDSVTEDYFTRTASGRGEAPIRLDGNGSFSMPASCAGLLRAWDDHGNNVRLGNAQDAEDHLGDTGEHVELIYEDLSDDGQFKVFPRVRQEIKRPEADEPYGIVTQLYGMACAYCYGITTYFETFNHVGSVQFARVGKPDEVLDYLALAYGVCARALNADADVSSANSAEFYERLYIDRTSQRSIATRGSAFAPRRGEYY